MYMYSCIKLLARHSWSVKTHLLTMNPLRLVDTYIVLAGLIITVCHLT